MKCCPVRLCLIAVCSAALAAGRRQGARSPVEKVVNLLKDLQTRIEQDGTMEQQTYDKYACWCEKTTARKAASITEARYALRALGQEILVNKGKVATLMTEIAQLQTDIKANEKAQADATAIRQKENAEYMAETAEMKQVLAALEKAMIVLRDGTKASSFLQHGTAASNAVNAVIEALPASSFLKPKHSALLGELTRLRDGGKYAPQSATIQGILSDMYDSFGSDLEASTEAEATSNRNYETLMDNKMKQLRLMQESIAKKESQKVEAEQMLADATQKYDDTEAQMKADIVFFDETKATCESKLSDWSTRSALRKEELAGIKQALEILSSDSARELFAKAIKPGKETGMDNRFDTGVSGIAFFQVATDGAYQPLRDAARRTGSLRLASLAARVREAEVGHFDAVITQIDKMVQTLKDEDADDIVKRDQCKSEYQRINSTVGEVKWLISKNEAKIDKHTTQIEELSTERTKTSIENITVTGEIAAMKGQRAAENAAFLQAKKDDQDAIKLLGDARSALTSYYTNNSIELGPMQNFILAKQGPDFNVSEDQAPEAKFSGKGHRKLESKGIVQLLTMIMEDLNDEIKNDMKAEEVAQLQYEKQLAAANKLQRELGAKLKNLDFMIVQRTGEKEEEKRQMDTNQKAHQDIENYRTQITPDCDWIIDKFTERASRRAAEMHGLVEAKDFLAGYTPSSLLDKSHSAPGAVRADVHAH